MDAPATTARLRPVYKALHRPLTDLRRRSPPVLPGAAAGRGDVQPLLLLPRRPADVRRALRLRAVGDRPRSADASDPAVLVRGSQTRYDAAKHDRVDVEVRAMLSDRPHPARLPGGRERSTACSRCGASSTTTPSSRRPDTSASSIGCAGVDFECLTHAAAPGDRPPFRGGAAAARRALPRLSVPRQADASPLSPAPCARAGRPRSDPASRRVSERAARRLSSSTLYLVLVYEAPHRVAAQPPLRGPSDAARTALLDWLSTARRADAARSRTSIAPWRTLHHKAAAFEVQLGRASARRGCTRPTRSDSSGAW